LQQVVTSVGRPFTSRQEVIMSIPEIRVARVLAGCTLLGLGVAALSLYRAGAGGRPEDNNFVFVTLLGSPLVGLALLALGVRHHFGYSLVVLAASGVYVAPIVSLFLLNPLTTSAGESGMGVGLLLLFLAGLEWIFVVVVGAISAARGPW
jgi:hypothetical protein